MVVGKRDSSSSPASYSQENDEYEQGNGTTTTPPHPPASSSSQRHHREGGTEDKEANPLRRRLSQNSSSSTQSRKGHHYGYKPGKIERINVHNFKSYAGKQVIGPFHDFTAVIGPNGAGRCFEFLGLGHTPSTTFKVHFPSWRLSLCSIA